MKLISYRTCERRSPMPSLCRLTSVVAGVLLTATSTTLAAAEPNRPTASHSGTYGSWHFLTLKGRETTNANGKVRLVGYAAEVDVRTPASQQAAWELQLGNVRPPHVSRMTFGPPASLPVSGDFNGDGLDECGSFLDGRWYLDWNGNGQWDGEDLYVEFGDVGDQPLVGDWNGDGKADLGVYTSTAPRGEVAVVGDWLGRGTMSVGLFHDGAWLLDLDGDRRFTEADACVRLGQPGDRPVVGDFNRDGTDELGVYHRGAWYLDVTGDRRFDPNDLLWNLGGIEDRPIVGDWDGDGRDQIGVMR